MVVYVYFCAVVYKQLLISFPLLCKAGGLKLGLVTENSKTALIRRFLGNLAV